MSEKSGITTSSNSGLEKGTGGITCPNVLPSGEKCGCSTGHKRRPSADALTRYTCGSCGADFNVVAEFGPSEFFSVALDK